MPRAPAFSQSTSTPVLGHVFHAVGAHLGNGWIPCRHAEEHITGRHELFMAQAAAVQQLEVEARGGAQLDDRRGAGRQKRGRCGTGKRLPWPAPATALTLRSGRSRSAQSLSLTKIRPLVWERPENPIPEIVMQDATASFSFSRKCFSILAVISLVCSRVEPEGSMTMERSIPWSSSGR